MSKSVGVWSEGQEEATRGQPKKMQVEKECKSVGLEKEDALNRDGEWELERLLLERAKSVHPCLWG
mgnify:CR=1 FL=1